MKRIVTIGACLFAILIIPLRASAAGGYVASRNSRVFHIPSCYHTDKIHSDNVIFYKTLDEAKRSGRRGCYDCNPENRGTSFYTGETYMWTSENPKIQNMLEDEYKGGYIIGFADGEESGFDDGYDEGYESGHNVGYAKGVEDGVKQAEETPTHWIVYAFAAAVLYGVLKFGIYIGEERNDKTIGELHAENMELHRILNKQNEAVYIIELIAQRNNLTMENMADIFYINYYKCMGYSDSDARALLDQEKQKRIQTKS